MTNITTEGNHNTTLDSTAAGEMKRLLEKKKALCEINMFRFFLYTCCLWNDFSREMMNTRKIRETPYERHKDIFPYLGLYGHNNNNYYCIAAWNKKYESFLVCELVLTFKSSSSWLTFQDAFLLRIFKKAIHGYDIFFCVQGNIINWSLAVYIDVHTCFRMRWYKEKKKKKKRRWRTGRNLCCWCGKYKIY